MGWRESLKALKRDREQTPSPTIDDPIHLSEWNMTLLKHYLDRGQAVTIWSKVLEEKLLCIPNEDQRDQFLHRFSDLVPYTLLEISTLAKSKISPEAMKSIHLTKKTLGGTFTPKVSENPTGAPTQ